MSTSFDDLVTAATVGLSRRPLPLTDLPGPAAAHAGTLDAGDPAAALLDAAALLTVAQRAGFRPGRGVVGPLPSPEDAAPELSARAERALRQIGGAQLAPGFAVGDKELLADLLKAASEAGYVASPPLLPDLLDAAVRTVALRSAVGRVLGLRGRWLAAHRTDWRRVVDDMPATGVPTDAVPADAAPTDAAPTDEAPTDAAPAGAAPADEASTDAAPTDAGRTAVPPSDRREAGMTAGAAAQAASAGNPEVWRTGSRRERHAYLTDQRVRDPQAGRALLAADWARLPADERAVLLAVLARGLSADDEEFLDAALDDRADAVRVVARRLLTLVPASRFSLRARERAAAVLRLERRGLRPGLAVSRPDDPDPAAVRDGIDPRLPSPSIGPGAWLLTQLIAAVPLDAWGALFGLPPADLVALPIGPGPDTARRLDVHAGWRLAAVNQGNREWAEALLAVGDPDDGGTRPPAAWPSDQRLAATLPPARRAARATALIAGANLNAGPAAAQHAITEVGGGPVPWPGELADAVVSVLGRAAPQKVLPRLPRGLLDLAARGLPATGGRDYAAELTRLADAYPQTWTPLLRKTAETILLRRAFLEEIR